MGGVAVRQQYGQRTKQGSRCQADAEEGRCKMCGHRVPSARETGICMMCNLSVLVSTWQLEARRHA